MAIYPLAKDVIVVPTGCNDDLTSTTNLSKPEIVADYYLNRTRGRILVPCYSSRLIMAQQLGLRYQFPTSLIYC